MRPIKFRGIVSDPESPMFGEFVFGDLLRGYLGEKHRVYIKSKSSALFEIFPSTVGQFVGIKDCNEHDIYEGDILEITHAGEKSLHTVFWGGAEYPAFNLKPYLAFDHNELSNITSVGNCVYVVGNIHNGQKIL